MGEPHEALLCMPGMLNVQHLAQVGAVEGPAALALEKPEERRPGEAGELHQAVGVPRPGNLEAGRRGFPGCP